MVNSFPETVYTGASRYNAANSINVALSGYWRMEEAAGASTVKNYVQVPGTDGTVVGDVTLGVPGLLSNPNAGRAARFNGGYIEVPDVLEVDLISVGAWFSPDQELDEVVAMMYVKFDEVSGTSAANSGYLGTLGTYVGSPTLGMLPGVPGVTGTAVGFNGSAQYATFPHHVDQRLNGSFSILWWATHPSIPAGQPRVFAKGTGAVGSGYEVYHLNGVGGPIYIKRNNQEYAFSVPFGTLVNQMHHYAIVYDEVAQTLKFYFDGVLTTTYASVTFPDSASTDVLALASDTGSGHHNVIMDDFLMYSVALSQERVLLAKVGTPIHVPSGQWFGGISRENVWGLGWQSFSYGWTFDFWVGGSRHIVEIADYPALKGQRYFVQGDYNGGTARLLINGVVVASNAKTGNIDDGVVTTKIGDFHGGRWKGIIDEVYLSAFPITNAGVDGPIPSEMYLAGITSSPAPYCLPKPSSARERIIYIRPDVAGDRKYTLHAPPSRAVLSEEGFGTPPLEYVTDRSPFQHGSSVRSFHLNPRQVQLVTLQNFSDRAAYQNGRQALLEILRPNALVGPLSDPTRQGKLLCYLGNGQKRQLDVVLESGPGFAPPQGGWREWSFTEVLRFIAHEPTWYNPLRKQVTLAASGVGGLTFPIMFPVTFESLIYGEGTPIAYLGDWPAYPVITVYGPITSPSVINQSTGHEITINTTIPEGYAAIVDLTPGVKSVTRSDGLGLLGFVSDDSDLADFAIYPDPVVPEGTNLLVVIGTATSAGTPAPTVSYYDRYIGI